MATKKTAPPKTKKAASKPVAEAAKPIAVAEAPAAPPVELKVKSGPAVKKKDLIDRIVLATGGKKKGVKEIVEATLAVLGDALSKGEELNLPPFGKIKVNRQRDMAVGEMMTLKLRRGTAKDADPARAAERKAAKEALAEAGE